ncbi:hypothetical protein F751_5732 [Auxenochlorella protothecoides]|uniref:DUF1995 domain-containing protein n=1 Tax=Auxenochlorella protothecoides TaxID=3075 RepID=A0A087SS00_AUXPR|nr:hypothetical protein F751_5732 [Auxenochlorella protothecoides]KFM28504.1 hypothetical protein F751_5732 [Auxenochlorella protothecoides]RMZ55474.1 hypothetical protein APUTEX25_000057 [Auxenochlorella protothecoides]|eukprot:RMZ55474.1 hypothetical protein APUTEX25_000057 [Auxenochlorella protothecoides]
MSRNSFGCMESAPSNDAEDEVEYYVPEAARDDDVLPDSLEDALATAASATSQALDQGIQKAMVEVLLGEFWDPASGPIYSQQGDGARFWRLAKQFLDALRALRPDATFRVVFPDVGVAAMLKGEWTAPGVSLASLGDRAPASPDDDVVVLLGPDPQGVSAVGRLARGLGPDQALVMYNPRLASGDVGVGLNVRRMREGLLAGFTTAYHLRPIGDTGSLFKMYPGRWQVFLEDASSPGRYSLVRELGSKPPYEDLMLIVEEHMRTSAGPGDSEAGAAPAEGPNVFEQVGRTVANLQRFARSLSK